VNSEVLISARSRSHNFKNDDDSKSYPRKVRSRDVQGVRFSPIKQSLPIKQRKINLVPHFEKIKKFFFEIL
jgi:hypothetical protein